MTPSILITGAYGGMGKATAKMLRDSGFRVFALDKTVGEAEENIVPIYVDITDEQSVINAFEKVQKETDELFAIIHFAGIYMLDSLVEMESYDFERIFKINVQGAFLVNKTFLPLLRNG
ncbi:MAG: SDR family NAD(P)-dependent oxidoreductase, partial [Ruminococcus sp.]|nr:SDR family NAD(P)-dependent oxidoreductase [Ruminococcus sp.]